MWRGPVGKLVARSTSPISLRDRVDSSFLGDCGAAGKNDGKINNGDKKKRNPLSQNSVDQQRQALVSDSFVVNVEPGPTQRKQEAQGDAYMIDASSLNVSTEGTPVGGTFIDTTVYGVDKSVRTHRGTLELAGRIGGKSCRLLIDSGSTGNYISTQVCTDHKLRVEEDLNPDQLTMADGTMAHTEGKVQVKIKCGGYQGMVRAKLFPGLQKPMILGIP